MTTPMAETELMPCPFCGKPGSIFQKRPWSDAWRVCCDNDIGECPAFGDYNVKEDAIAAWNRRSISPTASGWRFDMENVLPSGCWIGRSTTRDMALAWRDDGCKGVWRNMWSNRMLSWRPDCWQERPSPPVPKQEGASEARGGTNPSSALHSPSQEGSSDTEEQDTREEMNAAGFLFDRFTAWWETQTDADWLQASPYDYALKAFWEGASARAALSSQRANIKEKAKASPLED